MADPSIAKLLDEACTEMDAIGRFDVGLPAEIRVSGRAFDMIVAAKADELARGLPPLLLGLEIVPSERLADDEVELTWQSPAALDHESG